MIGCLIGAVAGVFVNVVVPWWLGYKALSPFWLLLLAVVVYPTLGKNVVTYNIIWSGFRGGRPIRALTFGLIVPLLLIAAIDLLPYLLGRWMAHWGWLARLL